MACDPSCCNGKFPPIHARKHTRTHTHTHTHTHTQTYKRTHTHKCTRTRTRAHTRAHKHRHRHTHVQHTHAIRERVLYYAVTLWQPLTYMCATTQFACVRRRSSIRATRLIHMRAHANTQHLCAMCVCHIHVCICACARTCACVRVCA